jgi:uncharacterized protein YndB with AHSA1/START domain
MSSHPADIIEAFRLTRVFAAPPERVFRAWTVAKEFRQWWRPGPYRTSTAEMDVREGGRYRITMERPDGRVQHLFGTYLEVRPPERLAMTWSLEGSECDDGYEAIVTIEFKPKPAGTEVVLTHEKLPKRSLGDYEAGWRSVLDQLARQLTTTD